MKQTVTSIFVWVQWRICWYYCCRSEKRQTSHCCAISSSWNKILNLGTRLSHITIDSHFHQSSIL